MVVSAMGDVSVWRKEQVISKGKKEKDERVEC